MGAFEVSLIWASRELLRDAHFGIDENDVQTACPGEPLIGPHE